jgi:hypothetical protein
MPIERKIWGGWDLHIRSKMAPFYKRAFIHVCVCVCVWRRNNPPNWCIEKVRQGGEVTLQSWNSWTAFLVKVSGHILIKLESSQTWVFVWFSTLIFPFHKILSMNTLKFSCFVGFFVRILKPKKEEYRFLFNPPVERDSVNSKEQKTRVFLLNWCQRIPSLSSCLRVWA